LRVKLKKKKFVLNEDVAKKLGLNKEEIEGLKKETRKLKEG
jgi:hypothetical protein